MKRSIKAIALIMMLVAALSVLFVPSKVYAADSDAAVVAETNENDVTVAKAFAAAIVVAAVAAAGAIAMGLAICKAADGAARQPEIASKIQTLMMLGLVFVETAIIYALVVAIFIVFIL
jgi:F-type H+-transporting ATPase subunit c